MASTMTRRPLPALISLLALLVLAGIVWWRVADRASSDTGQRGGAQPTPHPCVTGSSPTTPPAKASRTTSPASAPSTVAPSSVSVRVLNSTNRSGLGSKVRTELLADGFRSPDAADNDSPTTSISGTAEIRYASGSAAAKRGAQLLAYYLPGSTLRAVDGSSSTVTVSIGDGYTKLASPAAVRAALSAAARPTGSPTGTSPKTSTSC